MEWFNSLPDGLKVWLISASADATGGIAGELVLRLLDASSAKVRRKLQGDPERQALQRAVAEGLAASLHGLALEPKLESHYLGLFETWLGRDAVVEELSTLLDPGEEALNRDLLAQEFAAAGADAEWLGEIDFDAVIDLLVAGFVTEAAGEPLLQDPLKIKLLEEMAQRMGALQRLAEAQNTLGRQAVNHLHRIDLLAATIADGQDVTNELLLEIMHLLSEARAQGPAAQQEAVQKAETTLYKVRIKEGVGVAVGDGATINLTADLRQVEQLLEEIRRHLASPGSKLSPDELAEMEANYRQRLVEQFETLTFKGMSPSGLPIALPLEKVYVELKAVADVPEAADAFSAEERRLLLEAEAKGEGATSEMLLHLDSLRLQRWKEQGRREQTRFQRRSIHETLSDPKQQGVVILGDPGSGKTTLLHYLALREARKDLSEPDCRLPVFIPLAAYDDFLRRNQNASVSLFDFLVIYYDQWRSLPGLKPLFQQALSAGRALVLLDGLDEVLDLTTRQFVAEQAGALIQQWAAQGNRFALTSRIVGYREARLPGNLPHVTVLDFGRAEIDVFARQWTQVYEAWAAGGKETATTLQRAESERKALLDDVQSNPSVERLAANPLLLTMLALLRRQVGKLPDRRIELYAQYVRTLIDNWEASRSQGARRQTPERFDPHRAIDHLIDLALWLQRNYASGTARTPDVTQELTRICLRFEGHNPDAVTAKVRVQAEGDAERFLQDMRHFAGLLAERGRDAFGFLHLTFQEYFVGRALARLNPDDRWVIMQPNLHNPRWREPILLCAGQLGVAENRRDQATAFVQRVLAAGSDHETLLHRDLFLATAMAADDVGLAAAVRDDLARRLDEPAQSMVPTLRDTALAGLAQLARLGIDMAQISLISMLQNGKLQIPAMRAVMPVLGSDTCWSLRRSVEVKLEDLDDEVRRVAVEVMAPLVSTDVSIRQLIMTRSDDHDSKTCEAAIRALAPLIPIDETVHQFFRAKLDERNDVVRYALSRLLTDTDIRRLFITQFPELDYEEDSSAAWDDRFRQILSTLVLTNATDLEAIELVLDHKNRNIREAGIQALIPRVLTDTIVRQLIAAKLGDEDADIRKVTVEALALLVPTEDNICQLITAKLDDEDWKVRQVAVEALAPLVPTEPTICQLITARLDDEDWNVRQVAVEALAPLVPTEPTICQLIAARLDDEDWNVRLVAVRILLPLVPTDMAIREAIDAKLDDHYWDVREAAVQTLAPMVSADSMASQLVIAALENGNHLVREAAIEALVPLVGSDATIRRAITAKLDDPHYDVRRAAIEALVPLVASDATIRRGITAKLDDPHHDVRRAAIEALVPLVASDATIRRDITAKLDDPHHDVRRAAIEALIPLDPIDTLARSRIMARLGDEDFAVVRRACNALASLVSVDDATRQVIMAKLDDPNANISTSWIEACTPFIPVDDAIRQVITAKLTDLVPGVRTAAIEALAPLVPMDVAIRELCTAKLDDPYDIVQAASIQALAPLVLIDAAIRQIITSKLDSWSSYVCYEAIQALAPLILTDITICQAITAKLDDPASNVQTASIQALAPLALANITIRELIIAKLGENDAKVQKYAIRALTPIASTHTTIYQLIIAKLNTSDSTIRFVAINALVSGLSAHNEVRAVLLPWLGLSIDGIMDILLNIELFRSDWDTNPLTPKLRKSLADAFGPLLVTEPDMLAQIVTMLNSPAWQARQGAAWALIAMPGGPPPEILPKLYGLLYDMRGEESWPGRLQVAELLINDRDRTISRHAIRVAVEALDYATQPWYDQGDSGRKVRVRAALILGQIEPLYQEDAVFQRLVRVMHEDDDEKVRDAAYGALLRLAAAPEETGR